MRTEFDAIIIGSGQAGPFLAVRLAKAGYRTALIERAQLGGTCVNLGCMPTKALVASARAAHLARRAGDFGVRLTGAVEIDLKAVRARKDAIVRASRASLEAWVAATPNLTLVRGHARFAAPGAVQVEDALLHAPRIFINVGGRPVVPDWPGLSHIPFLTSSEIMELDAVPERLVVAGASYIGLEFAQIFRRFGAEVTVIDVAERLVAREDPDVSAGLRRVLEDEGIRFHLGVKDIAITPRDGGFRLEGRGAAIDGSHLLLAVGRRPNSDGLSLERAGVAIDARGFIPVDEELRTNAPGVWALGDVNGRGAFTHTAYNDHEIVAANLLEGGGRRLSDRIPAYALFTDPPLARVGMTEAQALSACADVRVGRLAMTRVGRARERGETSGFMKVLVDGRTDRLLGAAFFGIEADEAIHVLITAMSAGLTCEDLRRAVPVHPTVSELIPTLLSSLEPLAPPVAPRRLEMAG
jgi:pyruvate/2-oxoglutarate dehydrogenase complex dihydrolipoamide dehydrogenase (E3) component